MLMFSLGSVVVWRSHYGILLTQTSDLGCCFNICGRAAPSKGVGLELMPKVDDFYGIQQPDQSGVS